MKRIGGTGVRVLALAAALAITGAAWAHEAHNKSVSER